MKSHLQFGEKNIESDSCGARDRTQNHIYLQFATKSLMKSHMKLLVKMASYADLKPSHFMRVNLLLQHFFGRHHCPLGSGDGDGAFSPARVGCRHTGTIFIKFELFHQKLLNSCKFVVGGTQKYVKAESKKYGCFRV
jgi:hypothetical protein